MSVYNLASNFINQTNRSVFITGKAGTGKTTFLHRLRNQTNKRMAIVAPTGVAAINAGGVTMHSFFQLPLGPFFPTEEGKNDLLSKQRINRQRRSILRELELLVIDEISMVRADLLDAVDVVLRSVRHQYKLPFGGVQVIFIGDLFQLSPVAKDDEWRMLSQYYESVYFFHSHVLKNNHPLYIEFNKIFRQTDNQFIDLLNQVRNDKLSHQGYQLLQSRYNPTFRPQKDDLHITLTTHNYKADEINREELNKIHSKSYFYEAKVKGSFPENSFPTDQTLEFKVNAKVIFIKNDSENPRRYYNGKIGTITMIDDEKHIVYVQPADPDEVPIAVEQAVWENIRYSTNSETLKIEEEVIGKFTQFPLRLAWAVTIHKSQGLTFDKAIIDAGASFAPGQVYVALSRCRSLEGITLLSPINSSIIKNDDTIVEFSSQETREEFLNEELAQSMLNYQYELLQNLYDFLPLVILSKSWYNTTKENESAFDDEILYFISDIIDKLSELEKVGNKFGLQLKKMIVEQSIDKKYISERLRAAAEYFIPRIDALIIDLKESPATTDNLQAARRFDSSLLDIYSSLSQKKDIIGKIPEAFSIEDYFVFRNQFVLPNFKYSSYGMASVPLDLNVEHADLLTGLINLRNQLSKKFSLSVYSVAPMKTLKEMVYFLPHTEKDMLKISGVGKVRFERFGKQFLDLIVRYCEINNLKSNMNDLSKEYNLKKSKENKSEKKKTIKGASALESLKLWKEGVSISDIAEQRGFVEGTIAGHLAKFIENGELDISEFITNAQLEKAEELILSKSEEVSLFATLINDFTPIEIKLIISWIKKDDKKPVLLMNRLIE